jgi:glucose-1-phosphate adenylyltransferase
MDSDHVLNIDFNDVIRSHEKSGAAITFVTKMISSDYSSKTPRMMLSSVAGKITDISMSSTFNSKNPELALNIFVMKTTQLRKIIEDANAHSLNSFTKWLLSNVKKENFRNYCYNGYVASVSSFLDYYKCSIELAKDDEARSSLLWKKEAPIFTRVHNSSPASHGSDAKVENSMLADECVIEGTVINSVLFRGVRIGKGSVVKDSVLFHGTTVGSNVELNCIVTDKDVYITDGVKLSGNENMPFYVQKNRKV